MRKLEVNRIYKHFKGDYYIVLGTGINSETLEEYVIYRALYGEGKVYLREINNFLSEVGKYFLDISKLTFGGLILSSIVGMNFDLENLMVYGIAASFFFALFGFTFIRVANEK